MSIYKKLFEIQKVWIKAKKDWENEFLDNKKTGKKYKYVTLDNLMNALEDIINDNGLLIFHNCDEWNLITTVMDVESNELIKSSFQLNIIDPQKQGSAITYGKRYNLSAIFNVMTEEDDDGRKATEEVNKPKKTEFTQEKLDAMIIRSEWKNKGEIMQQVVKIKKEYTVSKQVSDNIDLFLQSVK